MPKKQWGGVKARGRPDAKTPPHRVSAKISMSNKIILLRVKIKIKKSKKNLFFV